MDAIAATQGVYSRQNTKSARAEAVVMLLTIAAPDPNNTERVDTTLSLAINPVIRAVDIHQSPKPNGMKIGAMMPDTYASILSRESETTFICISKVCKNQITIVAMNITVNALWRKSFAFSHRSLHTFPIPGIL